MEIIANYIAYKSTKLRIGEEEKVQESEQDKN
jgi:hypothetical protein